MVFKVFVELVLSFGYPVRGRIGCYFFAGGYSLISIVNIKGLVYGMDKDLYVQDH